MQRLTDVERGDNRTRIMIGTPKSRCSVRVIPMSGQLAELCGRMRCLNDRAYILTGGERYIEPRTLQYRLKKYTFATRAVEAGFEIKSLSEILGHSTTRITLDRYVHSSLELKRSNMNKLAMLPV